jgi:hypothetical protein
MFLYLIMWLPGHSVVAAFRECKFLKELAVFADLVPASKMPCQRWKPVLAWFQK